MGQWLAEFDDQQSRLTNDIKAAYHLLEASGLSVVYLIPGYFAENTVGVLLEFAVQLGLLVSPFGAGCNPVPSHEDLAAVIAALLQNPVPYVGQRLRPTGAAVAVSARNGGRDWPGSGPPRAGGARPGVAVSESRLRPERRFWL